MKKYLRVTVFVCSETKVETAVFWFVCFGTILCMCVYCKFRDAPLQTVAAKKLCQEFFKTSRTQIHLCWNWKRKQRMEVTQVTMLVFALWRKCLRPSLIRMPNIPKTVIASIASAMAQSAELWVLDPHDCESIAPSLGSGSSSCNVTTGSRVKLPLMNKNSSTPRAKRMRSKFYSVSACYRTFKFSKKPSRVGSSRKRRQLPMFLFKRMVFIWVCLPQKTIGTNTINK